MSTEWGIAAAGLWLTGVFWLGLFSVHGTPNRRGLGRDLFRPLPLLNLLLWPVSLPAWLAASRLRRSRPPRRAAWIALAASLLAAYPLSSGPLAYAYGRGWLGTRVWDATDTLYAPAYLALDAVDFRKEWQRYNLECRAAGHRRRLAAAASAASGTPGGRP